MPDETILKPRPVSTASADHYAWGRRSGAWRLVENAALSVIEERVPAGDAEERHYHVRSGQFFYVLRGTLVVEVEGIRHSLGPRWGLEVSPGHWHQMMNEGAETAEFLVISVPPSHDDRHTDKL